MRAHDKPPILYKGLQGAIEQRALHISTLVAAVKPPPTCKALAASYASTGDLSSPERAASSGRRTSRRQHGQVYLISTFRTASKPPRTPKAQAVHLLKSARNPHRCTERRRGENGRPPKAYVIQTTWLKTTRHRDSADPRADEADRFGRLDGGPDHPRPAGGGRSEWMCNTKCRGP